MILPTFVVSGDWFTWTARAIYSFMVLYGTWELIYPERSRQQNLRLYDRYTWIASARIRKNLENASTNRLRAVAGFLIMYGVLLLLLSFNVLR
jgi:hypothetical protein